MNLRLGPCALVLALACALAGRARGAAIVDPDSLAGASVHVEVELALRSFDHRREDGAASGRRANAGLARAAVGLTRSLESGLDARVTLVFERVTLLEEAVADTVLAEDGQPRVEEAVLAWGRDPMFGFEAGLLLVPVGLLNEAHEAARFAGSVRDDAESRVIPVVWSAPGAGVRWSSTHGLSGRVCVVQGLDASRFSADDGIRDGRPKAASAARSHAALAMRMDWEDARGAGAGGSLYTGDSWLGGPPATGPLRVRVTLREAHAWLRARGASLRALYVMGSIGDHAALTRALGLAGTSDAIGSRFFGGFVEAAYDVAHAKWPGTLKTLAPFARWDLSDTQDGVGAVGSEDPSRHRRAVAIGIQFAPRPGVLLKVDRQQRHDELRTQAGEWNAAAAFAF